MGKRMYAKSSGQSVLPSDRSDVSALSRVSATIQSELHVEWRIARSALELGKLLGRGGFGPSLAPQRLATPIHLYSAAQNF